MVATRQPTSTGATRWHDIDWNAVLAGQGTADRYFARPGLIRKDRLALFAPPTNHPETSPPFDSFDGLVRAIDQLGGGAAGGLEDSGSRSSVRFVLKKAHSSNASGIRFFSGDDARALCHEAATQGRGESNLALAAPPSGKSSWPLPAIGCGTLLACVGTLAIAVTWYRDRKYQAIAAAVAAVALSQVCVATAGNVTEKKAFVEDLQREFAGQGTEPSGRRTVWILQRHVEPALLGGRKFHLRALFLCVGDLRAYVHSDVRALLATELFELARIDGRRLRAHITNMAAQQLLNKTGDYDAAAQNLSLAEVAASLFPYASVENRSQIFDSICFVLGETLTRLRASDRRHFFSVANCWELFGADLLLEAGTKRVVLLELNPSPSLAMYGEGSEVRARLLGSDPLCGLQEPGWRRCFPLDDTESGDPVRR